MGYFEDANFEQILQINWSKKSNSCVYMRREYATLAYSTCLHLQISSSKTFSSHPSFKLLLLSLCVSLFDFLHLFLPRHPLLTSQQSSTKSYEISNLSHSSFFPTRGTNFILYIMLSPFHSNVKRISSFI